MSTDNFMALQANEKTKRQKVDGRITQCNNMVTVMRHKVCERAE